MSGALRPASSSLRGPSSQGLTLLGGAQFITWRLRRPIFEKCRRESEVFLYSPDVSGLRPCTWTHQIQGLVPNSSGRWDVRQISNPSKIIKKLLKIHWMIWPEKNLIDKETSTTSLPDIIMPPPHYYMTLDHFFNEQMLISLGSIHIISTVTKLREGLETFFFKTNTTPTYFEFNKNNDNMYNMYAKDYYPNIIIIIIIICII